MRTRPTRRLLALPASRALGVIRDVQVLAWPPSPAPAKVAAAEPPSGTPAKVEAQRVVREALEEASR